jgi:hypothetical protein
LDEHTSSGNVDDVDTRLAACAPATRFEAAGMMERKAFQQT